MEKEVKVKHSTSGTIITCILAIICLLWIVPALGVLVTSFRTADATNSTGWWKAFANLKAFTLDNYDQVLFGQRYSVGNMAGTKTIRGATMMSAFLSSITVTVPSVIIPIFIACAAAYAFAWLDFKGRRVLFGAIIAMLVVPLQISLIPILKDYQKIGLNGTYLGMWLAHTGFGLPLATYMMYNYISALPRSILESSFIDGASHFTTFVRLILPLSVPVIVSFAIFQFIWVWNDMLISLVFLSGAGQGSEVVTVRLMNMAGTRGTDWHLLTAGAFISMILPLGVFLSLQRFFVKGLLAGSVKG